MNQASRSTPPKRNRSGRLDERGVALPLALFGLVAISLLVTTALLTSSTEVALSRAHQDGTRSLYAADAALEQFVAQRAAFTSNPHLRLAGGTYPVSAGQGPVHDVRVAELFRSGVTSFPDGSMQRNETYSLVSQPATGRGRSVGALVEAVRTASMVRLNVDSGLTLGVNATIGGSPEISDGSSPGAACDSAKAVSAIRHSANTTITQQGNGQTIVGGIHQDTRDSAELMDYVLDGFSIDDLAALATIRFGPLYGQPAFNDSPGPSHTAPDVRYRWGCPTKLMTGCSAEQGAFFPAIAIDANGGTVDITGAHGQGIVLVKNGGIHIHGSFLFQGIILVEGALRVTGTPRLEGAVIAMGDEAVIEPGTTRDLSSGNSLVRFNRCEIVNAQRGLTLHSLNTAPQEIQASTFAWFEVVR